MLDRYIASPYRQQSFSKRQAWYLWCITAAGALARILYHYDRPFTYDEVGTLLNMVRPVSYLLSHFQGWLTENYFILAEKVMGHLGGGSQISVLLIPLVAGIATIPLTAVLASMLTSRPVALVAATLVAVHPFLILYSGIIRGYSVLAALALVVLILFFRWWSRRTFRNGIYVAVASLALLLDHLNGVYVLAFVLLLVGVDLAWSLKSGGKSPTPTLIVPLAVVFLLVAAAYAKLIPDILVYGNSWHSPPPTSIANPAYVTNSYFGNGFYGWLSLALLGVGLLATYKDDRPLSILLPYIFLPIPLMAIQGIDYFPWTYTRFLIFLLPVLMLFVAEAVWRIGSLASHTPVRYAAILAALVIATWLPALTGLVAQRLDWPWNRAASFILAAAAENDAILFRSSTEWLQTVPYFSKVPHAQFVLESYTKEAHARVRGANVFLLRTQPFVVSDYPSYTFGQIQVIIYPRVRYSDQLRLIRDDFLRTIRVGDLSPELAFDYRSVWTINKVLGLDAEENFKYFQLYMLSNELAERQRNIPLPLQTLEYETVVQRDVLGSP